MSLLSLQSTIRGCKLQAGEAARIESDRFLNPENMVCPMWTGFNLKGQSVCSDSFNTKSAGCNSASERVVVENDLRPNYSAYINLNVDGIQGDMYNQAAHNEAGVANAYADSRNLITGSFGNQWASNVQGSCGMNAYEKSMAEVSALQRKESYTQNSYQQNNYQKHSGNRSCGN
jgi:hypothetical protein